MAFDKIAMAIAAVAAATIGAALAASDAPVAAPPPGPGLDLINERCGFCHTTGQALGVRKTPANWALVVQSMIDRGAELSPEEQKIVTDYLAINRAASGTGTTAAAPAAPGTH
jgi:hypothetical protein